MNFASHCPTRSHGWASFILSQRINASLNGSASPVLTLITGDFPCGSSILNTFLLPLAFFFSRLHSLFTSLGPWALRNGRQSRCVLSIFYERRWAQNLDDLRQELNIEPPPVIISAPKKQDTWEEWEKHMTKFPSMLDKPEIFYVQHFGIFLRSALLAQEEVWQFVPP